MSNPILPDGPDGMPWDGPLLMFHDLVDHAPLFAFIDGMLVEYQRFEKFVTPVDRLTRRGHLVLVSGPDGVGKSSFVQWCARKLERHPEIANPLVFYFGLAALPPECVNFRKTAAWLLRQMALVLEGKEGMTREDIDKLLREADDPYVAFGGLVDVLHDKSAVALIILPQKIPLEWVRGFRDMARARMVFFAEWGAADRVELAAGFGEVPTCYSAFLQLSQMAGVEADIREILTNRVAGMDEAERKLVAEALRNFPVPREAIDELVYLFDIRGSGKMTPSKVRAYQDDLTKRLLKALERKPPQGRKER
ncbi:hypothetical protein OIE66_36970 [Nonomuraea sp. NBC_01738]|uniref:hypothetical protein n=1 Tax=Nonomuraea sp. NBC_01738 TaxID=2976003 RepID=UPI002E13DEDC|nr:hypothetical protein OIE66_36970 [Nonomuraea sp. NBC_01738]